MPDAFDDWLGNFGADDFIGFADAYAKTIRDFYQGDI